MKKPKPSVFNVELAISELMLEAMLGLTKTYNWDVEQASIFLALDYKQLNTLSSLLSNKHPTKAQAQLGAKKIYKILTAQKQKANNAKFN